MYMIHVYGGGSIYGVGQGQGIPPLSGCSAIERQSSPEPHSRGPTVYSFEASNLFTHIHIHTYIYM